MSTLIEPYTKSQAATDARQHLLNSFNGILSTHMRPSHALSGYPLGSVVPFCLHHNGHPIVLISDLAQHTQNILANNKVSLLINQPNVANIQKGWRLTMLGDIEIIPREDYEYVAERYERFFPGSREYHEVHDFAFYLLKIIKYRFINGFGMIHWLDTERVLTPNIFDAATEHSILQHMNEDHRSSLVKLLHTHYQTTPQDETQVEMVASDQYGCVIRHEEYLYRIYYPTLASNTKEVRERLIALCA